MNSNADHMVRDLNANYILLVEAYAEQQSKIISIIERIEDNLNLSYHSKTSRSLYELRRTLHKMQQIMLLQNTFAYECSKNNDFKHKFLTEISDIGFSSRTLNKLTKAGVNYLWELLFYNEGWLLRKENFGNRSYLKVKEVLSGMGLKPGMFYFGE